MCNKEKSVLGSEIESIYLTLMKNESDNESPFSGILNLLHPQSKRIIYRYVLSPFLAIGVIFLLWLYFQSDVLKVIMIIFIFAGYVGIFVVQILEFIAGWKDTKQFFNNPIKIVLSSLQDASKKDLLLLDELGKYSSESLKYVKCRIDSQEKAIEKRIGVLVGAIEKIGIIPGVLTLYLAAISHNSQRLAFTAAVVVLFMYFLSFIIHFSIPRLSLYSRLLEHKILAKNQ